jgi:hypothetical protein
MSPEQHAQIALEIAAMPTVCGLCHASTTYGETVIHEESILYTNEDGSPKPVYHGMATIREYRICKTH